MVAGPAPECSLDHEDGQGQRHQHGGQLQRRILVERAVPDPVDGARERLDAEEVDRAEIGQCLHDRERGAGGQGRPGQRDGDVPHGLAVAGPRLRAASMDWRDWPRNALRPSRYT